MWYRLHSGTAYLSSLVQFGPTFYSKCFQRVRHFHFLTLTYTKLTWLQLKIEPSCLTSLAKEIVEIPPSCLPPPRRHHFCQDRCPPSTGKANSQAALNRHLQYAARPAKPRRSRYHLRSGMSLSILEWPNPNPPVWTWRSCLTAQSTGLFLPGDLLAGFKRLFWGSERCCCRWCATTHLFASQVPGNYLSHHPILCNIIGWRNWELVIISFYSSAPPQTRGGGDNDEIMKIYYI